MPDALGAEEAHSWAVCPRRQQGRRGVGVHRGRSPGSQRCLHSACLVWTSLCEQCVPEYFQSGENLIRFISFFPLNFKHLHDKWSQILCSIPSKQTLYTRVLNKGSPTFGDVLLKPNRICTYDLSERTINAWICQLLILNAVYVIWSLSHHTVWRSALYWESRTWTRQGLSWLGNVF